LIYKNGYFCIILTFLLILIYITLSDNIASASPSLKVGPEINIRVEDRQVSRLPPFALRVASNESVENVKADFSDLHTNEEGKLWIARSSLRLSPPIFNLSRGQISNLDLVLDLPNQTGTYTGIMTLSSNSSLLKDVPIHLSIYSNIPYVSLILVALGAIASFIVKFVKLRMDDRNAALSSLDRAEEAARIAGLEDRLGRHYVEGDGQWERAFTYLDRGEYDRAKKFFDAAEESYRKSKGEPGNIPFQRQLLTNAERILQTDNARTEKGILSSLRRSDNLFWLIVSVILAIGIMQTWTQIYSQLIVLSGTPLWQVGAFLLGYGSQSLLGEVFEFAKRR